MKRKLLNLFIQEILETGYNEYREAALNVLVEVLRKTDKTFTARKEQNLRRKCQR
jgi:hypothetical protein